MPAGRYAPSPSGDLHLGNLRTALLAWVLARSRMPGLRLVRGKPLLVATPEGVDDGGSIVAAGFLLFFARGWIDSMIGVVR